MVGLAHLFTVATALVGLASSSPSLPPPRLQVRQQQAIGTPLYLDEPACDFYQCDITWYPGDHVTAHWLDAPTGNVILDMTTDAGATFAHHIATVPGTTTNCDAEGQSTCGQFSWIVPSDWLNGTTYGNYSLRATSVPQPDLQSFTDIILVKPANGTAATQSVAFSALDPTATDSAASASVSATSSGSVTSAPASATSITSATAAPASSSSSSSSVQKANAAARIDAVSTRACLAALGMACAAAVLIL